MKYFTILIIHVMEVKQIVRQWCVTLLTKDTHGEFQQKGFAL